MDVIQTMQLDKVVTKKLDNVSACQELLDKIVIDVRKIGCWS